ncbi:ABC transporter domain-containing protein [Piedraia hortae CBS 480.64]|uniref:ABC transporter domain-containing protein n=1 Tax=Piedraia hortae CBS 480.64 TaxID=1314780 RepID=A0A6A7BQQ1_9PEZI|nr:ABC transporter domain-containing protein [Piedraia hortae CBS 480.64]
MSETEITSTAAANTTATPPSHEDIASLTDTIYKSKTSQASLDASYALTDVILNSVGYQGLHQFGILNEVTKAATDKKNAARREGAMFALGAIFERFPARQKLSEVVFLLQAPGLVPCALDALADKQSAVREGAQYALDALFKHLSAEAKVHGLLPLLTEHVGKKTGKWQGTVGALGLMGRMAEGAKMGMDSAEVERDKDVLRLAMGKKLDRLIPIVEAAMHDLKSEVSRQALKTMSSLTTLLQNDDVAPRIPLLVKSMEDPSTEAQRKAIHALSQTTFVTVVESPVLALLTPLLERSLNTPTTTQEVTRQTVVVIENLTKLVHDPVEARAFLPKLKPGVERVRNGASLPEVREIGQRALDVMLKAMGEQPREAQANGEAKNVPLQKVLAEDVAAVLEAETKKCETIRDAAIWPLAKQFVSAMVAEDVNQRALERIVQNCAPYLCGLMQKEQAEAAAEAVHQFYVAEDHRKYGGPVKDDDGEVEIVNANFSLGYGGRLLLSHTNMRLLKGHRYGLCGRNGAGKSTLMRSIANGKLDGFPPQDQVRTCFVEHNQGEDADLTILDYCLKDPELQNEGREQISAVLEEVGFTSGPQGTQSQNVGSLSGGWKMKLALARAMLMRADVFLLDEPTNHLDVANIKWLQEYLKKHTEITSLIVSHDSGFLDEVCTDIYNYENKKLVHYRGNLAALVKAYPEAKSYYTLSATQAQFKFPTPGILTGVKSNTRSILKMTNATFTYPGASKPSLIEVSAALTLSSRVAIIGPNGAGKSTLIKVLTGEVVPQQGKVEKHPNLRIGYIKQHALEHVEMHLEKTPNQYLQWRYAHGDDREVLMKQTRVMTAEEREQMSKPIEVGDGRGARQIEALIGRQKYKKSFQYEVKWVGWLPKFNTMISRETLLDHGFQKLVQEFDDHEASREGLGFRQLEPQVISKHFEDLGLDPEFANHTHISGLSGGQKVKVVLAGAMWNNPHLLVLDEPTNFLDRDSLGGLAVAIRDYRGGVVMISHNEEFVGALCPEQWHVNDGRLTQRGHLAVNLDRFDDSSRPASALASSNVSSAAPSTNGTPAGSAPVSEAEGDMKFRARKKKKLTRAQLKEREARRRLRHIEWLNSPKGTPKPPDTDDEA